MQYYLKLWGSAESLLCATLKVKDLNFWFGSKTEMVKFKNKCFKLAESKGLIIAAADYYGEDLEYKTVCEMVYVLPDGRKFLYKSDFGYGYPCSSAEFYHTEGNGSCDCNKSLDLQRIGVDIDEYPCGYTILIEDFKITKVLGEHFIGDTSC